MAEAQYECKRCGARFKADAGEEDLNCSECGSDEIERLVDALYARDREFVREVAEAAQRSGQGVGPERDQTKTRGARMKAQRYICRTCGFEFVAIPDAEEPPDCPECESDQTEKLERATYGSTTKEREQG